MNFRKISLLVLILLIADQALKIWVKTHMHLDESIVVFPDWFQLRFIENNGAAFGMHIATKGGFDWGKLLLGIFRIVMVGVIGWLMHHLLNKRKDTPKGVIVGLALVMAGERSATSSTARSTGCSSRSRRPIRSHISADTTPGS